MLTGINVDFEEVDLLAVGGGKAGKSLAMDLARAGQKVAMIGGTCINAACIPTKTLINSGRLLQSARRAPGAGVRNRRRRNRGSSESPESEIRRSMSICFAAARKTWSARW